MQLNRTITLIAVTGGFTFAGVASADWVQFDDQTETRLVSLGSVGASDSAERDYQWADLNNNGWVDLVVMRRSANNTIHAQLQNVLFMNEEGVLVDRTTQYALAVAEDQLPDGVTDNGFRTPVSDKRGAIADVDGDGWKDIITGPTLNDGRPKHISHPRIYMNLGEEDGEWQGFEFQNDRFPQLGGIVEESEWAGYPHAPRIGGLAAGDVTGDGLPDLYITNYTTNVGAGSSLGGICAACPASTFDFNDRLLINKGEEQPGYFVDETANRLPTGFTDSVYGTRTQVADFSGNGANDLMKVDLYFVSEIRAMYNTSGDGQLLGDEWHNPPFANPSSIMAADLNNNGRLDLIIAEDGSDRFTLNLDTDADGTVVWSGTTNLPSSAGFRRNIVAADLNNNGFKDILVSSVDFDLYGWTRESTFHRSNADPDNLEFTYDTGNIDPEDLRGTYDFAVFDITGNGWNDMVVAWGTDYSTGGTTVWINLGEDQPVVCPADLTGPDGEPDGVVDVFDLLFVIGEWGECNDPGECPADIAGPDGEPDGEVDVFDLLKVVSEWGACT